MHGGGAKCRIFGHWLSKVNTFEIKNVDKDLAFIYHIFNSKLKFQRNMKLMPSDSSRLLMFHFQTDKT